MEAHIQNIELINAYLNKRLSLKEVKDFENKLKTDDQFRLLYEEHIDLLEGIKRQELKAEIKLGKQRYIRGKWLRYFGFGSIVIILGVICFNLFNPKKNTLKNTLNFEADYTQQFKLASDSIIEVKGEKGTLLRFHPNDLETNSGEQFSGDSLTVELIELTTKQDLLLANAQTVSNGKWLISGGAFKIDIKANNEPLVLKEGKTIDVTFPKNTKELNMELFYGERDKRGYMNWVPTSREIRPDPFVIYISENSILDEEFTIRYQVDMYKDVLVSDTLGFMNIKDMKQRFPKGNFYNINRDTIRLLNERVFIIDDKYNCDTSWLNENITFKTKNIDSLYNKKEVVIDSVLIDLKSPIWVECRIIKGEVTKQISKQHSDSLKNIFSREYYDEQLRKYSLSIEQTQLLNKQISSFYRTIKISKLGWINIDKFSPEEEKVTVKLDFNLKINHRQIYVIDERNNTVLNVYNNEINLPINKSFKIMAFGMKDKQLYGFKKSVRYKKNGVLDVNYKKINESQIKGFMTLK